MNQRVSLRVRMRGWVGAYNGAVTERAGVCVSGLTGCECAQLALGERELV